MHIDYVTAFLYSLNPKGIRFGLENTRYVLDKLGRPQDSFRSIHLAGSNGKGSTAAFLDSVLRSAGLKVGLYTSPHLSHFRERFRINGIPVDDAEIGRAFDIMLARGLDIDPRDVKEWIDENDMIEKMSTSSWYTERGGGSEFCRLTFFECTTVLAFLLFARAGVQMAVVETGMGGRLDATNVLMPEVSVITPIQLEHTAWLGETISAIAEEKAGIIKPGVPVVSARQKEDARFVIERVSSEQCTQVLWLDKDFSVDGSWQDATYRIGGENFGPIRLGLAGVHQVENSAVALACLPLLEKPSWPLSQHIVNEGLCRVSWPGRFERFGDTGRWILDGAHNPDGIRVLSQTIKDVLGDEKVQLVFGVLGDKDAGPMLEELLHLSCHVHLARPRDARGRDPRELLEQIWAPTTIHSTVTEALETLDKFSDSPVLITGSLTVVGEAREWLTDKYENMKLCIN